MAFTIRQASGEDADAIAAVFSPSHRLLTFLPELHTIDEDRTYIAEVILTECTVLVAETDRRIIAFLARDETEIRMLHTHPEYIGQGAGAALIDRAKQAGLDSLELWCFQQNHAARRFYERHGFQPVLFTDGTRNEEKTPDIRYRWERTV